MNLLVKAECLFSRIIMTHSRGGWKKCKNFSWEYKRLWIVQKGKTREKKRKKRGSGEDKRDEDGEGGGVSSGRQWKCERRKFKGTGLAAAAAAAVLPFFFSTTGPGMGPRFLSAGLTSTPSPVTAFNPRWKDVYLPANEIFFPPLLSPSSFEGLRFGRVKQPGVI